MTAVFCLYDQILCASMCKDFASCWCGCFVIKSYNISSVSILFLKESILGAFTTYSGRKFPVFTALFGTLSFCKLSRALSCHLRISVQC